MSRIKKYNFLPEHQLNSSEGDSAGYSVHITKNQTIYFSPFIVKMWGLDKKIVRIYADITNKTIAWKEITNGDLSVLKNVRQLNSKKESNSVVLSVSKILSQMGITKEMLPIKNVPVSEYTDSLIEGRLRLIDLRNYDNQK